VVIKNDGKQNWNYQGILIVLTVGFENITQFNGDGLASGRQQSLRSKGLGEESDGPEGGGQHGGQGGLDMLGDLLCALKGSFPQL
jgi:hypothetical protein